MSLYKWQVTTHHTLLPLLRLMLILQVTFAVLFMTLVAQNDKNVSEVWTVLLGWPQGKSCPWSWAERLDFTFCQLLFMQIVFKPASRFSPKIYILPLRLNQILSKPYRKAGNMFCSLKQFIVRSWSWTIFILGECSNHTDIDFCERLYSEKSGHCFLFSWKKGFKTCTDIDITKTCPENGKI